jgi:hypothetical protein
MEKESSGQRPVDANSTGGQGPRRAVAPSDDDDDDDKEMCVMFYSHLKVYIYFSSRHTQYKADWATRFGLNTASSDLQLEHSRQKLTRILKRKIKFLLFQF